MTTISGSTPRVGPPSTTSTTARASSVEAPQTASAASTGYATASTFNTASAGGSSPAVNPLPPPPASIANAQTSRGDLTRTIPVIATAVKQLTENGSSDAKALAELLRYPILSQAEQDKLYGSRTGQWIDEKDKDGKPTGRKTEERREDGLLRKIEATPEIEKALAMRGFMEGFIKQLIDQGVETMKKLGDKPKAWGER
ncbi:MAG: hypothetical protein INH41_15055 [Myxococcaceae bacterium]|nr:hypothetical protein [Myxococcaceae bacterium]